MRTDTTAVESNVHYPTDSTLLADGVRVLTRLVQRVAEECAPGAVTLVDHARAAKHRVMEIRQAAQSFTEASKKQMEGSYRKLVGIARGVLRKAEEVVSDLSEGKLSVVGSGVRVVAQELKLKHFGPLVKRVIEQTRARVFGGDRMPRTRSSASSRSTPRSSARARRTSRQSSGGSFASTRSRTALSAATRSKSTILRTCKTGCPRSRSTRRGSAARPDRDRRPRILLGGKRPRGERARGEKGGVAVPGKRSATRRKQEKQPWFRRALRWRGGIEGRIGTLKHRFDMERARYKGDTGFKRSVGWSVITNNLVSIARARVRRAADGPKPSRTSPPTTGASPSTRRTVAA